MRAAAVLMLLLGGSALVACPEMKNDAQVQEANDVTALDANQPAPKPAPAPPANPNAGLPAQQGNTVIIKPHPLNPNQVKLADPNHK